MKSLNQRKTAHDKPQLGPVFKHLFHLFQYIYFCFQLLNISIFVSGMNFLAQWSIFSFQSSNTLILVCKTNQEPYHENRTLKTKQNWKIKKFCREFSLPKWHWFWVKEYSDYFLWILKSNNEFTCLTTGLMNKIILLLTLRTSRTGLIVPTIRDMAHSLLVYEWKLSIVKLSPKINYILFMRILNRACYHSSIKLSPKSATFLVDSKVMVNSTWLISNYSSYSTGVWAILLLDWCSKRRLNYIINNQNYWTNGSTGSLGSF